MSLLRHLRIDNHLDMPRLIPALLYLLLGVATSFFPLTVDIHYEFAAVCALGASLIAGLSVAASAVHGERRTPREAILLSLLPPAVGLLRLPFGAACGLPEGLLWYGVLVPVSALIGYTLARLCRLMLRPRLLKILLFITLWSLGPVRAAWEGTTGPHIYFYVWQIGYFPGGSYDAELPLSGTLLAYRLAQLAAALLLLYVLRRLEEKTPPSPRKAVTLPVLVLPTAALVALALFLRPELGLTRTQKMLQQELGGVLRTDLATLYYNPATTDSLALWRTANLADFHIADEAGILGLAPKECGGVTLYLFASTEEQKRLLGTRSVSYTKPWLRMVVLTFDRVPGSLRHELAHIVLEPFGNPLGISYSQGLLEGSAMALENNYGQRTLHEYAAEMYRLHLAPPPTEVMGLTGFAAYRSSVSYVLAGSFSQWLLGQQGRDTYLRAFPAASYTSAYGTPLDSLSKGYLNFIDSLSQYVPPSDQATLRYYFAGGSFFHQRCLRRIGTLNAEGYDLLVQGQPGKALKAFERSLQEGINYGARGGIIRALAALGNHRALLDSSAVYGKDTASYPLLPLLPEQGDAYWAMNRTDEARRIYDSTLNLNIGQSLNTRAALRLYFLDAPEEAVRRLMREYYTKPLTLPQRSELLEQAIHEAGSPVERMILEMMRASLTLNPLPRFSLSLLSFSIGDAPKLFADAPIMERRIAASLLSDLLEAQLYADEIEGRRSSKGYVNLLDFIYDDMTAPEESRRHRNERRTEAVRFIRYLHKHPVLP